MFTEQSPYRKRRHGSDDCLLPLPVEPEYWLAAFHIYADASGKLAKSDYTSFCGYVGHVSAWQQFMWEWQNCRFRWQVPPIHMAKIVHPERNPEWLKVKVAWGSEWESKRNAMLEDFAATVKRSEVVCVGAVVDAAHFKQLAETDALFAKVFRDTMYLALHRLVKQAIEKTEVIDKHSPINLLIDDDQEYSMVCYKLLQAMKRDDAKVKERIHAIA